MHISSADKKEKPWFLKALKTRRNPFFDKTVRKTGFIHMVREMRLELTRRLPHAPQTCLSTYSSTLAYLADALTPFKAVRITRRATSKA